MTLISQKKSTLLNTFVLTLILELNYSVQISSETSHSNDLPLKSDLAAYLKSIERIIKFSQVFNNDIDLNLDLGLFLLNVNLKHAMLYENASVPLTLKRNMNRIFKANGALIKFFENKAIKNMDTPNTKKISFLFNNLNSWVRRTKEYRLVLHDKVPYKKKKQLQEIYLSWNVYMNHVNNLSQATPRPEQSDNCIAYLADYNKKRQDTPYKCLISEECSKIIKYGSWYGYALTHRMLFLLIAHYGLGCYVYSAQEDLALIAELCGAAYSEAWYIALNGYRHPDLLMEQIGLCALPGHAEFLQRRWLTQLLRFQTSYGCFGLKINPKNVVEEINTCHSHLTAVAAATLGAAVRYITES